MCDKHFYWYEKKNSCMISTYTHTHTERFKEFEYNIIVRLVRWRLIVVHVTSARDSLRAESS